ncbi:MAG: aminopeptidase P family protein [Parachlamydiaceae bacterium]|nr:aminopeptidase P family protein [Parachlamydiaceae bacterium]
MNYIKRIKALSEILKSIPCDALLVENPTNLLYLTGLDLSTGKLLITSTGATLLVDGRYIETCLKYSPCPVHLIDKMSLKDAIRSNPISTMAFESDKTMHHEFLNLQKLIDELRQESVDVTLTHVESPVQKMRLIKDDDEIKILAEAARLGYEGFEFVVANLKEGITEEELALELEYFWRKKGAKKVAFDPIIAFGPNGSMPHYRAGESKLQKNQSVLIDIGVTWKHYHSDMTRVIFFGEVSEEIQKIYKIVEEAKQAAISLCKPGTLIGDLDKSARHIISSKGYGEYFTHSLGHGIGLDVHEIPTLRSKGPFINTPLEPGMVITIEPGIYLPDIGGVRLEDTIVITKNGFTNLTKKTQ